MNMKVIKKTRKHAQPGDIFVYTFNNKEYMFGRVIKEGCNAGGFPNSILLYFYKYKVKDYSVIPSLKKEDLIIPPQMTNYQGWFKGYYLTIKSQPLADEDYYKVNYFKNYYNPFESPLRSFVYRDEYGNQLSKPKSDIACAVWGLASYRTIDDDISAALGIPLSPD